jgi:ATP-dependent Zn protease
MSEATGEIVDLEIRALLARGLERAKEALQSERARLDALATALLEHESLDGDRLAGLLPERRMDEKRA